MDIAVSLLEAERVGIGNLKANFSRLLREDKPYVVTDHGQPKQVIVSYNEMIELVDMLDELSDHGLLNTIHEGRVSIRTGEKGIPLAKLWEEMKI
ncbi:MAG: type II toxin-antitoxin system prevent-host-death family antitoxin [Candidatus Desantisbacteria bacterium]